MIIIGAGIIGLTLGWRYAREGISVKIFDRGESASHVAAGMLTPYTEAGFEDEALLEMGRESLALYPQFLKELAEDTGTEVPLHQSGSLIVAIDRDDQEWLKRIYEDKKRKNQPVEWLSDVHEKEPLLSPRVNSAIWIEEEYQIDNQLLIQTLKQAFVQCGGQLFENCPVKEILDGAIRLEDETIIPASPIVLAAGAQSLFFDPMLPIRPIKGQILTLQMTYSLKYIIRSPRIYLVPKENGTLRVGATSEDVGLDPKPTAGAVWELLEYASEVLPAIQEFPLEKIDVGFRPTSENHLPIIEQKKEGVYVVTGHGRSGFLLAPYTWRALWTSHLMEKLLD